MITYRQATRAELDKAVDWAAREGWNPGLCDAEIFWNTDPEGFVCAVEGKDVVATGSIVSYSGAFGFMGFFIVRPDLRGKGIGRGFWTWRRDTLLTRLKPGATIGLDCVFDMQPFYSRGGFEFTHRNLRMEGIGRTSDMPESICRLSELPFETVSAFDRRHFGFARDAFLRRWIDPPGGRAFGFVEDDNLKGMGVIRPCRDGYKIGPLFADSARIAHKVFGALSSQMAGRKVLIDIPENNPAALALASRNDFVEVFGCARMYHGPAPDLPWGDIYGVTTSELG